MTPEPIPQDLLAVHDLLRETLATARDNGGPFQYGVAVFPRTGRFGAPVFGIATSGGESTVLTYRMLQSLVELPVYISGRVPATIREGLSYGPPRVIPVALKERDAKEARVRAAAAYALVAVSYTHLTLPTNREV